MAEELIVARDIKLTRYAESKLHFTGVSTKKSLEYIQRGKDSGAVISCSVTPYHLYFCDEDLQDYDSNLKVNLPLRNFEERTAMQKALANGLVDCIATHHLPHEYDSKVLEFEYAKHGMIGLETAFAALNSAVPGLSPELWVQLLSINPRKIFGLPAQSIEKGKNATITLFDPFKKWTVSEKDIKSKSKNSPFIGMELTGKVAGIIHGNNIVLN
jgi:dihydroorotase